MELRHLRYFVAVAEELHFGRAAERLGISQPPLSQQIRALEEELDARLFERTNRRVELSEAGRALLAEAQAMLNLAERAAAVARQAQRGEIGKIGIGFVPSASLTLPFTNTILAFRKAMPGVRLQLTELVTAEQIAALSSRQLDIGFIRSPDTPDLPEPVAAIELCREPFAVFMPMDHPLGPRHGNKPLAVRALAGEPFVFFPRDKGTSLYDQVFGMCRKAGFTPRIEQEASENATILGLVAAGLGISILPLSLSRIGVANVVHVALTPPGPRTSMWLIHRRHDLTPASEKFVAIAKASMEQTPGAEGA